MKKVSKIYAENFLINPDVIYRYEPKIEEGTLFVFNIETGKIFTGNKDVYNVLSLLLKHKKVEEVIRQILLKNPKMEKKSVAPLVKDTINLLLREKILIQ